MPGSLLAIKGQAAFRFKVLVLEGGPNGKGILYYNAFGGLPVSVVFNGVKAYRDATGQNGCVYDGEMPVEGSDNTVLDRDVQSRLLAIYNRNNNPTSYAGSFDQALKDLKDKAEELKGKSEITNTDWTQLNTYIVASNKGFSDWKEDINAAFGNDVPEEVRTALTRLGEIEEELAQLSACATENIPQGAGGDHYLNLTAMLRLACAMQFDKLIAKQEEAEEISGELEVFEIEMLIGDPIKIDMEKVVRKTVELSKKYSVNEAGELVIKKGGRLAVGKYLGKIFGTIGLILDPVAIGNDPYDFPEYREQLADDLLDARHPSDDTIPLATDVANNQKGKRKYVTYVKVK